jgi:hypothetical protein
MYCYDEMKRRMEIEGQVSEIIEKVLDYAVLSVMARSDLNKAFQLLDELPQLPVSHEVSDLRFCLGAIEAGNSEHARKFAIQLVRSVRQRATEEHSILGIGRSPNDL